MGDPLYDQDFYLWTQDQARRLRALEGDNRLDTDNLAEEVADLGRSELNKVASHLRQALIHLLKAAWVPDPRLRAGWTAEVRAHLDEASDAVTPGMRQKLDIDREWQRAWPIANGKLVEHGDAELPQPIACPLTLDELISGERDVAAAVGQVSAALRQACDRHT